MTRADAGIKGTRVPSVSVDVKRRRKYVVIDPATRWARTEGPKDEIQRAERVGVLGKELYLLPTS